MPRASYSHETATPLSPAELWKRLQIPETWANIGPVEKVWDARHTDSDLAGFRWSTTVGHSTYEGTAEANVNEPGTEMVLQLSTKELLGALTARITAHEAGSQLVVTLAVEPRGMLASLFFPAISQAVGSGLSGQVEEFVRSLED